jgi:uncharacterized RDD family membrane protein YckC
VVITVLSLGSTQGGRRKKLWITARFYSNPGCITWQSAGTHPNARLDCTVLKTQVASHMDKVTSRTPRLGEIAGFWRRLFAFCVDGLVLGVLGGCVGLVAHDRLVALGDWGRAVGFAIALVYFATLDSALSGGRSPGKRLLGIQVVNADGMPLSLGASTVRATIFCVPYFLNGAVIDASGIVSWLLAFLVFGVGFSIVYLLLFNRRTRQSLHDLAVGAYVVTKPGYFPGQSGRVWPGHFAAVGLIVLTATVALPYFGQRLASSLPFATLRSVQQALQQDPDVRHASALVGVSKFFGKDGSATTTGRPTASGRSIAVVIRRSAAP